MNKVVPTMLAMSALLLTAGCSSSGSSHSSHSAVKSSHASYSAHGNSNAQGNCTTCGAGYHAAPHAHSNNSGNAMRHSHAGAAGHAHSGFSAGYGYTTNTVSVAGSAGRNTMVNTGTRSAAVSRGGSGGSTLVKIAGALIVGGLIYNATKDDDDDHNKSAPVGCVPDPDPNKNTC